MNIAVQGIEPTPQRRVPNLVSVREAGTRIPAIPEASFRDLIYHSEARISASGETIPANGFATCIVRIGGRVLIDFDAVLDWIETHRESHRNRRVT